MIGDVSEAGKEGWTVSQDRGVSDLLRPLLRSSVRLSEIVRPVCSSRRAAAKAAIAASCASELV